MEQLRKLIEQRLEMFPIDVESSPLNDPHAAKAYYDGKREAYEEILDILDELSHDNA